MNDNHVQQIFQHYIDKFEEMNNTEHIEYFKWQIINRFHDMMDKALEAPTKEFPSKLYELKRFTENMIDSYTQPFYGLVKFAEVKEETENVRNMFKDLYADDGGDLTKRREKVTEFLKKSHALRDKYYPDSYLYKDDMHSVTGYLFLYDPDHNYIFKASHAQIFADCVEFYDDWGSGDNVDLAVYYRLCDQLVEAIKASKELMATDASRFQNGWGVDPATLYPDSEKHILAFDLVYCCSTYGLFDGIAFVRPKTKERQLIQERKEKAVRLAEKLEIAKNNIVKLDEAKEYVNSVFIEGKTIRHTKYGEGTIKANSGSTITVEFSEIGEKQLGTFLSISNGIITISDEGFAEKITEYRDVLKRENSLKTALSVAEKEFAPYSEYLG